MGEHQGFQIQKQDVCLLDSAIPEVKSDTKETTSTIEADACQITVENVVRTTRAVSADKQLTETPNQGGGPRIYRRIQRQAAKRNTMNTGVLMRINQERRWTLETTIKSTQMFNMVL